MTQHEQGLRAVVDALKGKDYSEGIPDLRDGAGHMSTVGAGPTGAIAKKLSDKIGGDPSSKAAELLTNLNAGLREHVFLAAAATGAALGGRSTSSPAPPRRSTPTPTPSRSVIAGVYGEMRAGVRSAVEEAHRFLVDYTTAWPARTRRRPTKRWGTSSLHGGLRRLHQRRFTEAAARMPSPTRQGPRLHAQRRGGRPGGEELDKAYTSRADGRRPHGDDRQRSGHNDRGPVPRQVLSRGGRRRQWTSTCPRSGSRPRRGPGSS